MAGPVPRAARGSRASPEAAGAAGCGPGSGGSGSGRRWGWPGAARRARAIDNPGQRGAAAPAGAGVGGVFFRKLTLMRRGVKGPRSAGGASLSRRSAGTERRHRCAPAAPRRGPTDGAEGEPAGRAGPPLPPGSAVWPPPGAGTRLKDRSGVPGRAAPSGDSQRLVGAAPPGPAALPARGGLPPPPDPPPRRRRDFTAVLLLSRTYMDISRERA